MSFQGIFPIMPTPFTNQGDVDKESLATLVQFMKERQMDGLTVLGMMGEAPKLTEAEQDLVVDTVVSSAGDLPVIVGTGAASTRLAIERSKRAAELGAAGFLVAPPPTKNEGAIFNYYRELGEHVDKPIILHDYPDVTGVTMSPALIAHMNREIERVSYVKLEEAPTGKKITELRTKENSNIDIFGALGGVYCLEELRRGAIGIMTGFAYPEILRNIYVEHRQGNAKAAEDIFYRHVALMRYEFQPVLGLPLRKEIYKRRGAISSAYIRQPGPSLDDIHLQELDNMLSYLDLNNH